jgi:aminoglycoside phosphotransferase (APT) family kinase protein
MKAVGAQFPDLLGVEATLVGWGWDFDAYRLGDWAFLFPKRAAVADRLEIEGRRSLFLAESVSDLGVSVPVYERIGEPSEDFPHRFVGYRWITGVAADQGVASPELPARLGRVLTRIHLTDSALVTDLEIPEDREGAQEWFDEVIEYADVLRDVLSTEDQHCVDWLEAIDSMPPTHSGPLRLLHNDLHPEHILVDEESGELVGLIDWDDIAFTDPMLDFVGFYLWRGRGFVESVLASYEVPLDSGFWERLDFVSRLGSLEWLYDAHLQDADVEKHRRWVQNAFTEPT